MLDNSSRFLDGIIRSEKVWSVHVDLIPLNGLLRKVMDFELIVKSINQ